MLKANDAETICSLLANVIKTPEEASADPGFMVRANVCGTIAAALLNHPQTRHQIQRGAQEVLLTSLTYPARLALALSITITVGVEIGLALAEVKELEKLKELTK